VILIKGQVHVDAWMLVVLQVFGICVSAWEIQGWNTCGLLQASSTSIKCL
jgi:hypothetical protein